MLADGPREFDIASSEAFWLHCALLFAIVSLRDATPLCSDDCGIVFFL